WMVETAEFLASAVDEREWTNVVVLWGQLERSLKYPDRMDRMHWLDVKKRPAAIGEWIKRHRDYAKMPTIKDASQFGASWREWWSSLQPAWRRSSDGDDWPMKRSGDSASWVELAKGGPNGLVLVLIAVVWW
ncbi:hypothetical protein BV25DRAFT_1764828, partial [Artomyces pyxidatus]